MSQASLSSEAAASKEIASKLKRYFGEDLQPSFRRHLLLKLQDPFILGASGGFRLSALWTGLGALGVLILLVFLYFNFLRL